MDSQETASKPSLNLSSPARALKTFKETIYLHLRDAILNQQLKPSERLHEKQIADKFGVSTTPVREAIRKLEGEGYLDVDAHRRVTIKAISKVELMEIYQVLGALDSTAAVLATERMSPDRLSNLKALTEQMEAAFKANRIEEYLHLNTQIHLLIWKMAGNRFLQEILGDILTRMLKYPATRVYLYSQPGVLQKSMDSHREILRILQTRNKKDIDSICREHWGLLILENADRQVLV